MGKGSAHDLLITSLAKCLPGSPGSPSTEAAQDQPSPGLSVSMGLVLLPDLCL